MMKNNWAVGCVLLAAFSAQATCFLGEVEPHEHLIPHEHEVVPEPEPEAPSSEWKYSAGAYLWLADLGGKTQAGTDIDVDAADLLEDFQGALSVTLDARRDKWSFILDTIYLNAEDTHNRRKGSLGTVTDLDLSAWIITPMAGYNVVRNDTLDLNLIAGIRYIYIDSEIKGYSGSTKAKQSSSGDAWNGIGGFEGQFFLSERWSLPFHVDAGAGELDLTWQAYAGLGYALTDHLSLFGGYRYLDMEFDDDDKGTTGDVFDKLNLSGGIIGVKYLF